jgi:MoaA/NifB/PqqE/SkfB family radical SAM enzyme
MIKRIFYKRNMMPLYLVLGVTYDCNSRCRGCFSYKDLNKHKNEEMSLDEISKTLHSMGNIPYVTLTGGEPFLRKDISEICKILYSVNKTRQITIPTNCLKPDVIVESVKLILRNRKRLVVNLSIDALHGKHDYLRGVDGNFKKALETYEILSSISDSNLQINLHTVLSSANKTDIKEIVEYCKLRFPKANFHTFELLRGNVPDVSLKPLTAKEYEEVLPVLKPYWESFKNYSRVIKAVKQFSCQSVLKILQQNRQVYPCYAGTIGCVITPNGNLHSCEFHVPIGNLRDVDYDFKKLWYSEKADKQRRLIKNKMCHCTYLCFINSSLPFSLKAQWDFFWNTKIGWATSYILIICMFIYMSYIFAKFDMNHHCNDWIIRK